MKNRPRLLAIASLALAAPLAGGSGTAIAAKPPFQTSTWIGSNYTPAYAANQIQMWHEFKPEVIERELTAAVKYFGINTLRVYKAENDAWNLLRVAVAGNHIRAWLNPVHDDTRPMLEFTDAERPVLKGAIGLRVSDRNAWFDDVVVLPAGHE